MKQLANLAANNGADQKPPFQNKRVVSIFGKKKYLQEILITF
jgi:hypothetical protein